MWSWQLQESVHLKRNRRMRTVIPHKSVKKRLSEQWMSKYWLSELWLSEQWSSEQWLSEQWGRVETMFSMYSFIFCYEAMEFLKNGHGKSWKSHGISFPDVCGNPVIFLFQTSAMLSPIHVFSVPMFNFQVNPTVEVCWPPKSNNDRTYVLGSNRT